MHSEHTLRYPHAYHLYTNLAHPSFSKTPDEGGPAEKETIVPSPETLLRLVLHHHTPRTDAIFTISLFYLLVWTRGALYNFTSYPVMKPTSSRTTVACSGYKNI